MAVAVKWRAFIKPAFSFQQIEITKGFFKKECIKSGHHQQAVFRLS
jgi:hypothetical protein